MLHRFGSDGSNYESPGFRGGTALRHLTGPRPSLFASTLLAGLLLFAVPAHAAVQPPPLLRQFCNTGSGAGQCEIPIGVAADPTSGDIYVADQQGRRIEKFTAWGDFLRAWGWDVVAEGPDNQPPRNQIERLDVDATAGSFTLFTVAGGNHESGPIPFDASAAQLKDALEEANPPYAGIKGEDLNVTGPDGGPWTVEFTGELANVTVPRFEPINSTLSGAAASVTATPLQLGGSFEICVPALGDLCKAGQNTPAAGGLGGPQGLALDSVGDLYVTDRPNSRVEKFSPDGQFLLTFGGEVNATAVALREEQEANSEPITVTEAQENLCTAASGDTCQAGTEGSGQGQFGFWKLGAYVAVDTNLTATSADDILYVGDQGRLQEFDPEGHYLADLPDPDHVIEDGGTVNSLALDQTSGAVYLGFFKPESAATSKPDIHKLDDAGEQLCAIEAHNPTAVAVAADGSVYLVAGVASSTEPREIERFDSSCGGKELLFEKELGLTEDTNQFSVGTGINPTGIATSSACGIEGTDLLISNPDQFDSFVKLFGPPPQDLAPPCSKPAEVPPSIESSSATSVGSEGASVRARIDPNFWPDTAYHAAYATAQCIAAEGWSGSCVTDQPASGDLLLTETVASGALATKSLFLGSSQPLTPDTDYEFRFFAHSSGGGPTEGPLGTFHTYPLPAPAKADCPNQAFRIGPSAALPDCRAYELVSPPQKNGGEVLTPVEGLTEAATDGDSLTFASTTAFSEPQAAPLYNQYLSQREADGWSTRSISPSRTGLALIEKEELVTLYKLFSDDLCSGWLLQDTDHPLIEGDVPRGVSNLYRRTGLRSGCGADTYQLLTTVFPPGHDPTVEVPGQSRYYPRVQGASADGQVSVYRAPGSLTAGSCLPPEHTKENFQVYLSREESPGVPPTLVSVLPDGEAACTHSSVGTAQSSAGAFNTREDSLYHAVSDDGSRVYWTASQLPVEDETHFNGYSANQTPGTIYLRLNAIQPQSAFNKKGKCIEAQAACTLPVSTEAEAFAGSHSSRFLSAAADGSAAIFSTGDNEPNKLKTGPQLYEFDLARALAGEPADTLIASHLLGILGASSDAFRVYFLSTEALEGQGAAGKPNLYLHTRGAGSTFIATLGSGASLTIANSSAVAIEPYLHTARVSPDGSHAAFTSADPALAQQVAGYDNTDAASGRPDREVYLYDAEADGGEGKLLCASCNPAGAAPAGRLLGGPQNDVWVAATLPGWVTSTHPGNVLSTDGSRLFFESYEALLPRDSNGRADVYEWEAAADKSDCLDQIGGELYLPASDGCLSLISSGQSSLDTRLIDASADGRDVFIYTNSSLLPQDNGFQDVYDARAGGGFPAPVPAPPACEGEACKGLPAAPAEVLPASASFHGAGNVSEAPRHRCHRPRVRRSGRCVSKRKKRPRSGRVRRHRHRAAGNGRSVR